MKVLIADDDPVSLKILETKISQWGYEVVAAHDGEEAWRVLRGPSAPQLAVLDWMMPGRDGVQIVREIRDGAREPYVYVVLLTSRNHRDDLVEAMDAGSDDYVTKPFDPHELRVRLRAGRRIIELHEQLIAAREELRAQATHDSLTGVWNRAFILDALQRECERADRQRCPFSVVLADLDFFKLVNDRFGHLVGDRVLTEVAHRITSRVRPYDLVGRYGGEEFLIILPGCDEPEACSMADRLVHDAATPIQTGEAPSTVVVTTSLGVTTVRPGDTRTPEDVIRTADEALYAAKERGRARAVFAA